MTQVEAFGLANREAIEFLRNKVRLPTRRWDDLRHGAHVRAFSVAGMQADDMLASVQGALLKAQEEGGTLDEFRRDIGGVMERMGWAGRYAAWRSRLIFETNLRTAYAASRYAAMTDPDVIADLPFWRYHHSGKERFRPQHKAWDQLTLRHDAAWWRTHMPPNGWGCGCWVEPLSAEAVSASGGPSPAPEIVWRDAQDSTGEPFRVPEGIDPGWGYNVGESWLRGAVPRELAEPLRPAAAARRGAPSGQQPPTLPPLPPARPADPARRLPADVSAEDAAAAFLGEFGATLERGALVRDVTGTRIAVAREMFETASGALKAAKRGRGQWMLLLADALRDPDEVWADFEVGRRSGDVRLKRRYLLRLAGAPGVPALIVFEWSSAGWRGATAFAADEEAYLEAMRSGALLYRRPEE